MFRALFGGKGGTEVSDAAVDLVQKEIQSHKVVIFSKSYCPYCTKTKSLFRSKFPSVPPRVIELDQVPNGSSIQSALAKLTSQRTVPNVFVGGKHVGGNDDTHAAYDSGRLQMLLNESE